MNLKKLAKELNYLKEDTDYIDSSGFHKGITPEEEAIWQQFLKDNPGVTIGDIMKNPEIRSIWRRRATEKGPDVKYISGDLDNATIELEGKVYKNVQFEEEDEINTGRMAYDEPIRHEYIAKVEGVTFTVETESFGEEGEREVQWDTLEAEYETTDEGSCGYAPDGEVDVHNTDMMTPAGPDLIKLKIREIIRKEIKRLKEAAGPVPIDNKKFYYIEDRKSNEVLHRGPLTAKSAAAEMEQYRNDNSVVAVANRYNKSLWLPGYAKGPREKNTEYPDSPNKLSV